MFTFYNEHKFYFEYKIFQYFTTIYFTGNIKNYLTNNFCLSIFQQSGQADYKHLNILNNIFDNNSHNNPMIPQRITSW